MRPSAEIKPGLLQRLLLKAAAVFFLACAFLILDGRELTYCFSRQYLSRTYKTATGLITDREIQPTKAPRKNRVSGRYLIKIAYQYTVNGIQYKGSQFHYTDGLQKLSLAAAKHVTAAYPIGASTDVYYNPQDPSDAVLSPGLGAYDFVAFYDSLPFFMLSLAYLMIVLQWLRRLLKFPGGAVKLVRRGRSLYVGISGAWPSASAFASSFFPFLLARPIIEGRSEPLLAQILTSFFGLGIAATVYYFWRKEELIINENASTIELPKGRRRKERVTLFFPDISDIIVEEEIGRKQHRFIPTLIVRGRAHTKFQLGDLGSRRRATEFSAWLRQKLLLPPSSISN
jgi:hypothetical protein